MAFNRAPEVDRLGAWSHRPVREVLTRAEAPPRARQQHGSDAVVALHLRQGVGDLRVHGDSEAVEAIGPVQGQPRHAPGQVEQDGLIGHAHSLGRRASA